MTTNPSEPTAETQAEQETEGSAEPSGFVAAVADALGHPLEEAHGTIKVAVPTAEWKATAQAARDELGLSFFSWLSATDWAAQVDVGDPPDGEVDERYEVMCALSDLDEGNLIVLSTDVSKDDPRVGSLVSVYPGANWHERETNEMFGIDFDGHPDLKNLYLPDSFEGHPLRKSFPLLTREVKPWPGKVDVEDMPETPDPQEPADPGAPSTENPEA